MYCSRYNIITVPIDIYDGNTYTDTHAYIYLPTYITLPRQSIISIVSSFMLRCTVDRDLLYRIIVYIICIMLYYRNGREIMPEPAGYFVQKYRRKDYVIRKRAVEDAVIVLHTLCPQCAEYIMRVCIMRLANNKVVKKNKTKNEKRKKIKKHLIKPIFHPWIFLLCDLGNRAWPLFSASPRCRDLWSAEAQRGVP